MVESHTIKIEESGSQIELSAANPASTVHISGNDNEVTITCACLESLEVWSSNNFVICPHEQSLIRELVVMGNGNIFTNLQVDSLHVVGSGNYFDKVSYSLVYVQGTGSQFENC